MAQDPQHPNRIIDVRFSFLPNTISALWSIEIDPQAPPDAHVRYLTHREQARDSLGHLWRMLTGS